jgi:hypothetical protein
MRDARSEPENRLSHARHPIAGESRKAADMTRCKPRTRLARFAQTVPLGRRGAVSVRMA